MGRMKKKGESGAKKAYITRRKAVQKLQVSLKDFRRLCILKGIYPVEPKNKSKVGGGSSQNKTYYLLSDIQFLSHEPILWKFWEFKIFMRKMSRARGRNDREALENVRSNQPFYKLDNIVKERYPTFIDALRDIDDALSMCFLYSRFSKSKYLHVELINICRRLTVEFMHYVIETRSLRKVFISIKGYYYQAEIKGQTITWVVPHQFNLGNFHDADYKVMRTFTEFYVTLLGFVTFKLYTSSNLYYPPKILTIKSEALENDEDDFNEQISDQIAALNQPLLKNSIQIDEDINPDEFDEPDLKQDNQLTFHQLVKFQKLFEGFKFFINREVPRESLVFVIRSFGGLVSWEKTLFPGATFDENDESITHQIVDRDDISNKYLNRYYIQPQWVFDCVNARTLLPVEDYFIGAVLPPHLSPFVEDKEGEYVPPEKIALNEGRSLNLAKEQSNEENEEESEEEESEDEKEIPTNDVKNNQSKEEKEDQEKIKMEVKAGKALKEDKKKIEEREKAEEKRLAVMMIPKKKRRLYDKIMFGKKRKSREVEKLVEKRKVFENESKKLKRQKTK
ncbi:pescadillo-like protein [Dinothrombium tinctorium]|uniref:Pescadillo homolog n=1 Tax=Dinothrombium tinctorium TaxID=1965070 RepID=A0A3S3NXN0_9ACAR|nr:pescadillo-like protein [Dinothrombium tinctorium]RWS07184.1 pescadillo-like protein [Dinothrombium tinctorium]RWS11743.1 pescadillo-like protein [Dinothrombium tinctorium]